MNQPIQIYYRFDWFHEKDIIQFSIKVGPAPTVSIGVDAESFIALCEGITRLYVPFLEDIKKRREEVKQGKLGADIKVEFNKDLWDKMMDPGKNEEVGDG